MKALPFMRVRWVVPGLLLLLCMPAVAQGQPVLSAANPVLTEVTGDGDAFVENFETWGVTVQLTNTGSAPATAISATLTSSTSGVTIGSGNSAYPDLIPADSASNITPFQFSLSALPPCGGRLSFTLTVAFSGGSSPETFNFTIQTGAPGAPVTFSYTGPVVPIPDAADLTGTNPGAPVSASLPVAAVSGNVRDVNLRIDGSSCSTTVGSTTVGIDHSFVNDLHVTLRSPSATSVLVMNEPDGGGNNFCQTVLDDESAGPSIQTRPSTAAPFTGSFTPNAPLSTFDGENPNGIWQLQVQDFFNGDTGNIRAWSVIITPAICDAPAADLAITKTDGVTAATPGGSVTYTITASNAGPDGVTGATVADTFPAALACTWTCVGAGGGTCTAAGSGNINDTVDLPVGRQRHLHRQLHDLRRRPPAPSSTPRPSPPAGDRSRPGQQHGHRHRHADRRRRTSPSPRRTAWRRSPRAAPSPTRSSPPTPGPATRPARPWPTPSRRAHLHLDLRRRRRRHLHGGRDRQHQRHRQPPGRRQRHLHRDRTISPSATGTLVNTATVTHPAASPIPTRPTTRPPTPTR